MQNTAELYQIEQEISFPKEIRYHSELSFGEKVFLAEVRSLCQKNKKHRCPISSRKMAELFGVSHQSVINWIKKLVDLDLVEVGVDYNDKFNRNFIKSKI